MQRDSNPHPTRGQVLKTVGAAGAGLTVLGSPAAAASGSRRGFEFRTVINMIDAGADSTGETLVTRNSDVETRNVLANGSVLGLFDGGSPFDG